VQSRPRPGATPLWIHVLAVLTVLATLPLLSLGAQVTTLKVGMVDPRGFRWPWEIVGILLQPDTWASHGLVIELTHRMLAFLVGFLAIALCIGLLWKGHGWKRWLGLAALAAVTTQGMIGRYRVDLNALVGNTLALFHGCVAQLVFALLVCVAIWTSPAWERAAPGTTPDSAGRLRRWSLVVAGLIYLQGFLGALVRHRDLTLSARAHLLTAFAVVVAVAWLARLVAEGPRGQRPGGRWVMLLAALVVVQLVLGVESWLSKFAVPGLMERQAEPLSVYRPEVIRSAHFVVGALLFATAVATALWIHRKPGRAGAAAMTEGGA
jgi:cytochrome c oxidase assembly protein subunit 15